MPYGFTFDLRGLPRSLFQELLRLAYDLKIHQRMSQAARYLVKKFRVQEVTGLNILEAISLFEDLLEIQALNILNRDKFTASSGRKVLFLPHCARKYMDSRCRAVFDPGTPTYRCMGCSPDCLINQASAIAREKGYDVYVLPGGSCIPKILASRRYDAVVGVACGAELKLGHEILRRMNIPGQAVPLLKNGCAETYFDIEELRRLL
jgi:hypothetical protein